MRTGLLILAAAMLVQATALAQGTLTFQMTNSNAARYWPPTSGITSVQMTTNLTGQVSWSDLPNAISESGLVTVTNAAPQQFFRLNTRMPLFQFAMFYNVNLEINPGSTWNVIGPVYCNQNIWEGSSACTFASNVSAVGTNALGLNDPFAFNYNGSGGATFSLAGQPNTHAPALSVAGLGTDTSVTNLRSMLELPPPAYALGSAAAYATANGQAYLANSCDLYITNFISGTNFGSHTPTGTNLLVYYQDDSLTLVPNDFFIMTNRVSHSVYITNNAPSPSTTNIVFAGYSWITNAVFYDWREGWNGGSGPAKRVEAVQLDLGKFNLWLTNQIAPVSGYAWDQLKLSHSGHHIDSVYVVSSVLLTGTQMPAVRVADGAQLPNPGGSTVGFTLATPVPVYVWGNYNSQNNGLSSLGSGTTNTLPAALMGDAITILSTNWSDSIHFTMPIPGNTTVNAAMLTGIVASNPTINGNYSGGVENFLRLLEDWSTSPTLNESVLTYNGSFAALFYSEYATNSWQQTGNYYNPPKRDFYFDLNFTNLNELPPLTPIMQ